MNELRTEHLLAAAAEMILPSRTRAAGIQALRQWAEGNCRPAAAQADHGQHPPDTASRRGRILDL